MEHDVDDMATLQSLLCGVLRQLYRKVTLLWETIFDRLRLWVLGSRNKTQFSRQKATVATSLAQILNCVELYSEALANVSKTVTLDFKA